MINYMNFMKKIEIFFNLFILFMISFRYKSNTKQIKIKSKRDLNERMSPWLQGIFGIKNPIVGFRILNNKYYDTETFFANKQKFYGQVVDIIDTKDQLQISFVSDNLNSSSNVRNAVQPLFAQDFYEEPEEIYKIITEVKSLERRLQDNNELTILFSIHHIFKNEILQSMNMIKSQKNDKISFYMKILQPKSSQQPNYSIYVGKKLVGTLNLTREYRETILMVIQRYSIKLKKNQFQKPQQQQKQQQIFKVSYDQQNEAPSFTTYQLQQRLNQQACQDYLSRMLQQRSLKKYQFLKLSQKCEENFVQFYKIFCEGAIDNDYQNFKNEVRAKVDNNLQLLLSNVDEMDLSRPISRQQRRKQNLKKSVPSIQIVKVENYFEILDQLKPLFTLQTLNLIKAQLLDENESVFNGFADYLSRKFSKEDLVNFLQKIVEKKQARPVSRCVPRPANRQRQFVYNSQDQVLISSSVNVKINGKSTQNILNTQLVSNGLEEPQKEQTQLIKLIGGNTGSESKQNKNDNKETPPMFGASKQQNNFSPIKYMSDIESNYKQAWNRLENKGDFFEPQQYGLLYYYLQSRDDSISNHIQQLEWNQQSSIDKLKHFLEERIIQILQQNFTLPQLDILQSNRNSQQINCIYENFKYESDLTKFLNTLHAQISILINKSPTISPSRTSQPVAAQKVQFLTKKASDSNLFDKVKKSSRKYSGQNSQLNSPKQSSFSHPKTNEVSGVHLQILNSFWNEQLQQMIDHCNFTEERRQEYIRQAFKQGNPSVFSWINSFVQGKLRIIDSKELKGSLKIKQQQNRYVMKVVPIFNQILRSFVEEGRISDKMRKWCVVQLMELNMSVIGAFECYIKIKNADQFVDNILCSFEMQNYQMEHFRSYIKRIQEILRAMSAHDQISLEAFNLYPKQIKAMCQSYFITGNIQQLMDSLDALYSVELKRRKFILATLNFSGINLNPFEFYDSSEQIKKISENMKTILETERELINRNLSAIDKFYQNNRISIRFGNQICQFDYLLTKKQYFQKWKENFEKQKKTEVSSDTIEATMLFDYYCYLSTVKYVYDVDWQIEDYPDKQYKFAKKQYKILQIEKLETKKLLIFLEDKQNRPASKIDKKMTAVADYLVKNDLDIFFLQETVPVDWSISKEIKQNYGQIRGGNSLIIYKKDKFGNPRTDLIQKYKQKLNFNKDSAYYFSDRGYLLMSIHLTSKPQFYVNQTIQIFRTLKQICNDHPLLKIIIGTDANHFIGETPNIFLNYVPKSKQEFTTNKMRTYLQVQFNKAQLLSKQVKDYIISNLEIKDYLVEKINGSPVSDKDLIPSIDHPYDHFIVRASI